MPAAATTAVTTMTTVSLTATIPGIAVLRLARGIGRLGGVLSALRLAETRLLGRTAPDNLVEFPAV